jgi:hypothetical protein
MMMERNNGFRGFFFRHRHGVILLRKHVIFLRQNVTFGAGPLEQTKTVGKNLVRAGRRKWLVTTVTAVYCDCE